MMKVKYFILLPIILMFNIVLILHAEETKCSFSKFIEFQSQKLEGIDTVFAEFLQTEHMIDARIKRERSGKLWASSDGRFRVEYCRPVEILIIYDGETIVQYFKEDGDIQVADPNEEERNVNPFYLWFNIEDLEKYYNVMQCMLHDQNFILSIEDKQPDSIITEIVLFINSDTGVLKKIDTFDASNNTMTSIEFLGHIINQTDLESFVIPLELISKSSGSPASFYE